MANKLSDFMATLRHEDLEELEEQQPKKKAKNSTPKSKKGKQEPQNKQDKPAQKRKPASKKQKKSNDDAPNDAPVRNRKSSNEALLSAYEYAASEQVSTDLTEALKGAALSKDLRLLLEVLVNNQNFRDFLLTQCEVKDPEEGTLDEPESYEIAVMYVNSKGNEVNEAMVNNILEMGQELADFNISERYYKLGEDGSDLGDASDEEIKEYEEALKQAS